MSGLVISAYLTRKLPLPYPLWKNKSDSQRSRLYMMEREFMGVSVYHVVSRRDLQAVADHACRYYRISSIRVVVYNDPDERSMGEFERIVHDDGAITNRKIRLNRGFHGANVCALLHELAHYVADDTYDNIESHGKQFVGIYMHLMDKYRVMPSCAFRALAKRCRVQIGGKFKPAAIRG